MKNVILPEAVTKQIEDLKQNYPELIRIRTFATPIAGNVNVYTTLVEFSDEAMKKSNADDTYYEYLESVSEYSIIRETYAYIVDPSHEEYLHDLLASGGEEVYTWER